MPLMRPRNVQLDDKRPVQQVATGHMRRAEDGGRYTFTYNGYAHPVTDEECGDVLVICDAQNWDAQRWGYPMHPDNMLMFTKAAEKYGINNSQITFLGLCPPVPQADIKSAARTWKHVEKFVPGVNEYIHKHKPKVVVTLGALASRAVFDRAVSITKARGVLVQPNPAKPHVFPMLSPGFIARVPEHQKTFDADISTLSKFVKADFDQKGIVTLETDYQWCYDLQFMIDNPPTALAVDTEGTGLRWHQDSTRVLTVQLSPKPGVSYIVPVDPAYVMKWASYFPPRLAGRLPRLIAQLKEILENPNIQKMGHNIKFDHMMIRKMGINMQNVKHDTQMMAFGVDENMMSKTLDDCVRVWVPQMSGYADDFNTHVDKNRMFDVPPEDILDENGKVIQYGMRMYAGGDTDATFRLARALYPLLRKEPTQWNVYERIHMPALMAFANRLERFGMVIDQDALRKLSADVKQWLKDEFRALIRMVPPAVRRKHLEAGLKFSRDQFVRDILFSPEGFNLKPQVFTKSTEDLEDGKKVPSVSTKDHMPYFVTRKDAAGTFVTRLIEYQKTSKMDSTYCGDEEEGTGFWQYLSSDGRIFPSFALHKTNTGRTASSDPNGQNYPKRGQWAKPFLKVFKPNPGYRFVAADLSQIELRIAAWESGDRTMLDIYRNDGDIHMMTAAATMRLSVEEFLQQEAAIKKFKRFCAKAVNFGFVYGMGAKGFRTYAKTQYGVDYTEKEAYETRELFFATYQQLIAWHERRKSEARKRGFVSSLHGAVRHLPSIYSSDQGVAAMAERQAVNAPVQRFGSDLGVMALTRLSWQADPEIMRPVGFVHDQVICEAKIGHELETVNALVWAMENPPLEEWFGITAPLPIKAEPDIGDTLGTTLELNEMPKNDDGSVKLPDWWQETGIECVNTNGTWKAPFAPAKPVWWNDNEAEAQEAFMRHLHV
ncbi:DNA polymerase I protein [Rhizobium phage RHph_I4]|nr:DNA polymerase I protein [Rhizobium phage RHph_I4]